VIRKLAHVTLVVRDYDEAIAFYRDKLGFELIADAPRERGKRWVLVGPGAGAPSLLLARADSPEQESRIGNQTGGRVSLFLYTDDFWAEYRAMKESGVSFTEEPREEEYGTVVVFEDLYGNLWDLLEPSG